MARSKSMKAILERAVCEARAGEELEAKHLCLDCSSVTVASTPKLCPIAVKPRCKLSLLQAIIRGRVAPEVAIHSDGWRGYNGLVDVGYAKHFRVDHSANEFALGSRHINGIESFWSFAKRRLQKFNGVPAHTFYLHLKECEWRFNNRQSDLYKELLKLLRIYPI